MLTDQHRQVTVIPFKVKDMVLLWPQNELSMPFYEAPYQVTMIKGMMITARERGEPKITRNISHNKSLPSILQTARPEDENEHATHSDEVLLSTTFTTPNSATPNGLHYPQRNSCSAPSYLQDCYLMTNVRMNPGTITLFLFFSS